MCFMVFEYLKYACSLCPTSYYGSHFLQRTLSSYWLCHYANCSSANPSGSLNQSIPCFLVFRGNDLIHLEQSCLYPLWQIQRNAVSFSKYDFHNNNLEPEFLFLVYFIFYLFFLFIFETWWLCPIVCVYLMVFTSYCFHLPQELLLRTIIIG